MKNITILETGVRQKIDTSLLSTNFSLQFKNAIDIASIPDPTNNDIIELEAGDVLGFKFFEENRIKDIYVRGLIGSEINILYDVFFLARDKYLKLDQTTPQEITGAVLADHFISKQSKAFTYNLDGTINTITFTDGRVITYSYTDGEIISWSDTIRTWTVIRDVDGNITNINIAVL